VSRLLPPEPSEPLHLRDEHRFVLRPDGLEAELVYRIDGDRLTIVHTEVPEALEGHGVGGQLVSAAVTWASAEGLTVVPRCPFARSYLHQHPGEAATATIDWSPPPRAARGEASPAPARAREDVTVGDHRDGHLDEQEEESFPASDPHSDWAGPG
jgi:predicted GNAT family acetyltransferase